MATVNPHKLFKQFLPSVIRYRGEVLSIDAALNRAKVQTGSGALWVTATIALNIGDYVLVEDEIAVRVLPALPYAAVEIS